MADINDEDFAAIRRELNRAVGHSPDFELPTDQWLEIIETMRDHARAWVELRTIVGERITQHNTRAKARRSGRAERWRGKRYRAKEGATR